VKQQEDDVKKRQKAEARELKAAASLRKKQQLADAKATRESAKIERQKERDAKAERLAHARREKQHQKDAANPTEALQLSQRGKRTTSKKSASKSQCRKRVVGVASGGNVAEPASTPPPKQSSRGRTIRVPSKYQ
jgi:hypothetical protein